MFKTIHRPPLELTNFAVRLRDFNRGTIRVEVVDSPVGRMRTPVPVRFNPDVIRYVKKLANAHIEGEMRPEELIEMGQILGDMAMPLEVRRMFIQTWSILQAEKKKQANNKRLGIRLLLELDDDFLSSLPWEYMYFHEYEHMRGLEQQTDQTEC